MANNTIQSFDRKNGLGTISFSYELVTSIIKKVLNIYKDFEYETHSIKLAVDSYYEVSIELKSNTKDANMKVIERIQNELLTVLRQSLALNCVLFLNITYGK